VDVHDDMCCQRSQFEDGLFRFHSSVKLKLKCVTPVFKIPSRIREPVFMIPAGNNISQPAEGFTHTHTHKNSGDGNPLDGQVRAKQITGLSWCREVEFGCVRVKSW